MESYVPAILFSYVTLFAPHFTKPSFAYLGGYLLGLLITRGRKTRAVWPTLVSSSTVTSQAGNGFCPKTSGA